MQFFASAITTLQTLVIALGAGLGVWGVVNLLEGYGKNVPKTPPNPRGKRKWYVKKKKKRKKNKNREGEKK